MRKLCTILVVMRLLNGWTIRTSFAPDEYFQCIEPAYLLATNAVTEKEKSPFKSFTSLTWEWDSKFALRTSFPVIVLSKIHRFVIFMENEGFISKLIAGIIHSKLARVMSSLLTVSVDIVAPILAQALITTDKVPISPTPTLLMFHSLAWSVLSHWMWFAGPRALVNSWECALSALAIALMLGSPPRLNLASFCAAIAVTLRPSSVPFWLVIFFSYAKHHGWSSIVRSGCIAGVVVVATTAWLDGCMYGWHTVYLFSDSIRLYLPIWAPLQWAKFNYLQANEAARLFGAHPWHWYFTSGVWAVAAPPLVAILLFKPKEGHRFKKFGWIAIIVYMLTHSVVSHKEDRFITPILPLLNAYAAIATASSTTTSSLKGKVLLALLALMSLIAAVYLSQFHQAAPEATLHFLRQHILTSSDSQLDNQTLHIVGPCYSTPGMSFLHGTKLDAYMLECDPIFQTSEIIGENCQLSASQQFEQDPFSFTASLYAHRQLPHFAITWDKAIHSEEDAMFDQWLRDRFDVLHVASHGHFATFGADTMVLWERKPM